MKDSVVTELYEKTHIGLKKKADHNKVEAQFCFFAVIVCSLVAPLFVTLGEGEVWGKIVPACLSVGAAGATSWLQLRKPQKLWTIYRRAQRELEREKNNYDFEIGEYDGVDSSAKILAKNVNRIAFDIHEKWEGVAPDIDGLSSVSAMSLKGPKVKESE